MVLFETDEDRTEEEKIARHLASSWQLKQKKLPDRFGGAASVNPIDRVLLHFDYVVGYVEIKRRHHRFGLYPSVFIDAQKYVHGVSMATALGVAFVFVVKFDCGSIRFYSYTEKRHQQLSPPRWTGNHKRNAAGDIEPIVELPSKDFYDVERYMPSSLKAVMRRIENG